jgi:hypothetical protein
MVRAAGPLVLTPGLQVLLGSWPDREGRARHARAWSICIAGFVSNVKFLDWPMVVFHDQRGSMIL